MIVRFGSSRKARWLEYLIFAVVALMAIGAFTALFSQTIKDTRVQMSPTIRNEIVGLWTLRPPGLTACAYGFVDQSTGRLQFTSLHPTFAPMQDCMWKADSLIGGLAFFGSAGFDRDSTAVLLQSILERFPQLRFFGVVHDTTADGGPVIFQMLRLVPNATIRRSHYDRGAQENPGTRQEGHAGLPGRNSFALPIARRNN